MSKSDIIINLGGDARAGIGFLKKELTGLEKFAFKLDNAFDKAFSSAFKFNQVIEGVDRFKQSLSGITQPLLEYDKSSRELQSITSSTEEELEILQNRAKSLSSEFGTSATQNLQVFQVALSKLTPELGASDVFMKKLGESSNRLSQIMYGDTDGAIRTITNSLNQYGVNLKDPMEASQKMSMYMDDVAKSAQIGAVEVPAIAEALQLTGNTAYNAGVEFNELQALIQTTGKFANEGRIGYVLRDLFMTMNKGDFIPKAVQDRMIALGVNIGKLQDPTTNIKDKLMELQKVQSDPSAFNQLFGQYANEAGALVGNIGLYDEYIVKMQESTGALNEMSENINNSYANRVAKWRQRFNNFKISIGEATSFFLPFMEATLGATSHILTFGMGLNQTHIFLKEFGILSKITGLFSSFSLATKFQSLMQWQLNIASYAFPGVWLIVGIGAVVGALVYAWNKFEGFRGFMYGLWNSLKIIFSSIKEIASDVFGGIAMMLDAVMNGNWSGFIQGAKQFGSGVVRGLGAGLSGGGTLILENRDKFGKAFADGRTQAHGEFSKKSSNSDILSTFKGLSSPASKAIVPTPGGRTNAGSSKSGSGGSSGSGRIMNTTIQKMVEKIEINVTKLNQSEAEIRQKISEILISAISDAEQSLAI